MKRIGAREAVGRRGSVTIIDVREDDEYATVHVAGSLNIPLSCFVDRMGQVPVDAPVYVICASGNRSARVTQYLAEQGYDAVNIDGGIMAWSGCGGPVVSGLSAGQPLN
jgi:rhodanese-related sulfurtransferase